MPDVTIQNTAEFEAEANKRAFEQAGYTVGDIYFENGFYKANASIGGDTLPFVQPPPELTGLNSDQIQQSAQSQLSKTFSFQNPPETQSIQQQQIQQSKNLSIADFNFDFSPAPGYQFRSGDVLYQVNSSGGVDAIASLENQNVLQQRYAQANSQQSVIPVYKPDYGNLPQPANDVKMTAPDFIVPESIPQRAVNAIGNFNQDLRLAGQQRGQQYQDFSASFTQGVEDFLVPQRASVNPVVSFFGSAGKDVASIVPDIFYPDVFIGRSEKSFVDIGFPIGQTIAKNSGLINKAFTDQNIQNDFLLMSPVIAAKTGSMLYSYVNTPEKLGYIAGEAGKAIILEKAGEFIGNTYEAIPKSSIDFRLAKYDIMSTFSDIKSSASNVAFVFERQAPKVFTEEAVAEELTRAKLFSEMNRHSPYDIIDYKSKEATSTADYLSSIKSEIMDLRMQAKVKSISYTEQSIDQEKMARDFANSNEVYNFKQGLKPTETTLLIERQAPKIDNKISDIIPSEKEIKSNGLSIKFQEKSISDIPISTKSRVSYGGFLEEQSPKGGFIQEKQFTRSFSKPDITLEQPQGSVFGLTSTASRSRSFSRSGSISISMSASRSDYLLGSLPSSKSAQSEYQNYKRIYGSRSGDIQKQFNGTGIISILGSASRSQNRSPSLQLSPQKLDNTFPIESFSASRYRYPQTPSSNRLGIPDIDYLEKNNKKLRSKFFTKSTYFIKPLAPARTILFGRKR